LKKNNRQEEKNSGKAPGSKERPNAFYRLTGMAIKMGVVIYLGVYLGQMADANATSDIPWFTLIGSLAGVAAAIYFAIKDVSNL